MITYVPGKGWVDDSITPGQPNGPLVPTPPAQDITGANDPNAATAVTFTTDQPGTDVNPTDTTETPP